MYRSSPKPFYRSVLVFISSFGLGTIFSKSDLDPDNPQPGSATQSLLYQGVEGGMPGPRGQVRVERVRDQRLLPPLHLGGLQSPTPENYVLSCYKERLDGKEIRTSCARNE